MARAPPSAAKPPVLASAGVSAPASAAAAKANPSRPTVPAAASASTSALGGPPVSSSSRKRKATSSSSPAGAPAAPSPAAAGVPYRRRLNTECDRIRAHLRGPLGFGKDKLMRAAAGKIQRQTKAIVAWDGMNGEQQLRHVVPGIDSLASSTPPQISWTHYHLMRIHRPVHRALQLDRSLMRRPEPDTLEFS
ncbi:uncharacterized protein LOC120677432 [Panicum virgatum]|uniref:uncharacterized protein LOC120677432 n=1 Tax=Panicum virgatum TaxID=38727 RepID=UPI0019D58248|nr:uncharacterized protein LOC120677432 [Panicum virgatum]